jgi:hypothetical protein
VEPSCWHPSRPAWASPCLEALLSICVIDLTLLGV